MSFRSKETLIQTRGEGAKQLSFTNGPLGRPTQQIVAEIAEVFAEVLGTVSKRLYNIKRLRERQYPRQTQQKLLAKAVTGL